MYSKEQITFLMTSGFSIEEIMQMQPAQPPVENPVDPVENPQPEPQPAPQPDPEPQPVPQPRLDPGQNSQIEQLIAQNNQLIQLIQRNNINGMQFGAPVPDRTVDDILAEIINPPGKK